MSYDPLDTRGQERAKAEADQRAKLARDTEADDIKWLMKSRRGRRIVWRILSQTEVFNPTFNTNAMTMAYREGIRFFGTYLLKEVHANAYDLYQVMVKESMSERNPGDGNDGRNDH